MHKVIAIIPARKGSKRLPGKNLMLLGNEPLIVHSINYAIKNNILIDDVYVSTDSTDISSVALVAGAKLLNRPQKLATDTTSTIDVLKFHVSKDFQNLDDEDLIVLLQPTSPFRSNSLISQALDIIFNNKCNSLATFTPLNKKYGIIRDGSYIPVNYRIGQRIQEMEPNYFENGLLYISKVKNIRKGILLDGNTYPLITTDIFSYVDIDEKEDLLFAEYLIREQII